MDKPPPSDYIQTTSLEDSVVHVTSVIHLYDLLLNNSEEGLAIPLLYTDIRKGIIVLFEGTNGLYFTVNVQRDNSGNIVSGASKAVHRRIEEIMVDHNTDEHSITGQLCDLPIVISVTKKPELVTSNNVIQQPAVISPSIRMQLQAFLRKFTRVFAVEPNTKFVQ